MHGLWVNGFDMSLLRQRLSGQFHTHQFSYNSVRYSPAENAAILNQFVDSINAEVIHFVGHSLGGLLIRHLFAAFPDQKPGRVVTLGTPHQNSHSAAVLDQFPLTRSLLGRSVEEGLLGQIPAWQSRCEIGSIAGTLRFGLGVIIPGLQQPSDGTVSVEETRLDGMTDHLCLPLSHFGLLLSTRASAATEKFLQQGHF